MSLSATERLDQLQLLWQGDAIMDVGPLWRDFTAETGDLSDLVRRIEAAGARDVALECAPGTLAVMRDIADA